MLHLRSGEKLDVATPPASPTWLKVTVPETPANRKAAGGEGGTVVVQVSARDLPTATGTLAGVVRFVSVDDAAKVIDVPVRVAVAGSSSASRTGCWERNVDQSSSPEQSSSPAAGRAITTCRVDCA